LWEVRVFLFPPRLCFLDFERAALGLEDLFDDALDDAELAAGLEDLLDDDALEDTCESGLSIGVDAGLILWFPVYESISFI
jgi:hypothetical protein